MDLTAENVYATFFDSLALDGESDGATARVKGLATDYLLNVARLTSHEEAVRSLLGKLSTRFYIDRGGGHSFSFLGTRRDGVQWGDTYDTERLLVLGLGLGLAKFCLKRRRWHLFPRGVPFICLNSDLFRLWATFSRHSGGPKDIVRLSFDPDQHPAPPAVPEARWYEPATFQISELASTPKKHVAETFYISIVVDGFFDDKLPSWILDPETTLQVY